MKRLLTFLFVIFSLGIYSQESNNCLDCAISEGFYCGDDPANWTVYSPDGCVPNGLGGLFYLNDGWEDCVDASDEYSGEEGGVETVSTTIEECMDPVVCDTVYVDVIEYIDVFFTDTIYVDNFILDTVFVDNFVTEYIYVTDTLYQPLDTLYVDVIEYVEILTTDTLYINVIEYITEYIEVFVTDTLLIIDSIIEIQYQDVFITEYVDCDTGLPCESGIQETLDKSSGNNTLYNLNGQIIRRPKGVYIENGVIKYRVK